MSTGKKHLISEIDCDKMMAVGKEYGMHGELEISWLWIILPAVALLLLISSIHRCRPHRLGCISALSMVLIAAVVVLWLRGLDRSDRFSLSIPFRQSESKLVLLIGGRSSGGVLDSALSVLFEKGNQPVFGFDTPANLPVITESLGDNRNPLLEWRVDPTVHVYEHLFGYENEHILGSGRFGLHFVAGPEVDHVAKPSWHKWDVHAGLKAPHWAVILLLSIVPLYWLRKRHVNRRSSSAGQQDLCGNRLCRFDLRGTPLNSDGTRRCGECGHVNRSFLAQTAIDDLEILEDAKPAVEAACSTVDAHQASVAKE